jgi:tRNA G46 methylase TrmB
MIAGATGTGNAEGVMSDGNSRTVSSNQRGPHPRLAECVARHLATPWRKPPAAHNTAALEQLAERLAADRRPRVLDSFCGTGQSTRALAREHGDCLVIGIDKSAARLAAHGAVDGDYLLLRADCEAVWQALATSGERLRAHYLLYPNPWPKAAQLGRRIHGHPAFPLLLALGGALELRSNWQLYVEEFAIALHLAGVRSLVAAVPPGDPLTRFEAKYRQSGHELWRCSARL